MTKGDYNTAFIIASEILAQPGVPAKLRVGAHLIAGTSIQGQKAIDHVHEAVKLASEYMEEQKFAKFADHGKVMIDNKEKDMIEAKNERRG